MKRELVTVDFSNDRKLREGLQRYARRERLYLAQVIRRACRDWLAQNGKAPARA